jgi:hypothetical protein
MFQVIVSVRHANQKPTILGHELAPNACLHMEKDTLKNVTRNTRVTLGAIRDEATRKEFRCNTTTKLLGYGWIRHVMCASTPRRINHTLTNAAGRNVRASASEIGAMNRN